MGLSMWCPWCVAEGKTAGIFCSFAAVEEHLSRHGATEEQIQQARESWVIEIRGWEAMRWQAFEACR